MLSFLYGGWQMVKKDSVVSDTLLLRDVDGVRWVAPVLADFITPVNNIFCIICIICITLVKDCRWNRYLSKGKAFSTDYNLSWITEPVRITDVLFCVAGINTVIGGKLILFWFSGSAGWNDFREDTPSTVRSLSVLYFPLKLSCFI